MKCWWWILRRWIYVGGSSPLPLAEKLHNFTAFTPKKRKIMYHICGEEKQLFVADLRNVSDSSSTRGEISGSEKIFLLSNYCSCYFLLNETHFKNRFQNFKEFSKAYVITRNCLEVINLNVKKLEKKLMFYVCHRERFFMLGDTFSWKTCFSFFFI